MNEMAAEYFRQMVILKAMAEFRKMLRHSGKPRTLRIMKVRRLFDNLGFSSKPSPVINEQAQKANR